jgi:hypothetical protein
MAVLLLSHEHGRVPANERRWGRMMVLVAIVISMLLGFVGLMGYMMYLTPGPSDRL